MDAPPVLSQAIPALAYSYPALAVGCLASNACLGPLGDEGRAFNSVESSMTAGPGVEGWCCPGREAWPTALHPASKLLWIALM